MFQWQKIFFLILIDFKESKVVRLECSFQKMGKRKLKILIQQWIGDYNEIIHAFYVFDPERKIGQ